MSSEAAGIARRAAAEIQRRGLHKGDYRGPSGTLEDCTLCAAGALSYAHGRLPDDGAWLAVGGSGRKIMVALHAQLGGPGLAQWNDRPETTVEDVISLLNAVADDLDAQ